MADVRATPFDLVFASLAEDRFPAIQAAALAGAQDLRDRHAFLMLREVVQLVHELRPDGGVGEGMDQLVALVHHAVLFWLAGTPTLNVTPSEIPGLVAPAALTPADGDTPPAWYAQVPERLIWAAAVPGSATEPLDGCFLAADANESLRVLGVFGLRPDRMGFTVVEVDGDRPRGLERVDGSPLFSSTMPGGGRAGLSSVVGPEELLELGWRLKGLAAGHSAAATQSP
ncbi:MAG: hypothetical protein H0U85_09375 [Gemmatimonadales bacterium]|nr:hypothetical protein [Gemmatimonadales bacterium]